MSMNVEHNKKRRKLGWLILANNISVLAIFPGSLVIIGLMVIASSHLPHRISFSQFLSQLIPPLGWLLLSAFSLQYFQSRAKKLMEEVLTEEEKWGYARRRALGVMGMVN